MDVALVDDLRDPEPGGVESVAQSEEFLVVSQFERDVIERDRAPLRNSVILLRNRFSARPLEEGEQGLAARGKEVLSVAGSTEPGADLEADQIAPEPQRPVERTRHQSQMMDTDDTNHVRSHTPFNDRASRSVRGLW